MSKPTDIEISRALNALTTTLNHERVRELDGERLQRIVDGALAGEHKIAVTVLAVGGARVATVDGDIELATLRREGERWRAPRELKAVGSGWAVPRR